MIQPDRQRRLFVLRGLIHRQFPWQQAQRYRRYPVNACPTTGRTSSPTHGSHPDTGRGKLDEREIVGVVLFEARGDSSKVLELVEEALHEIAQVVEKGAESWPVHAPGYGLDVGPGAALGHARAQGVAVIGAVAEQDLARTEGAQHVGGGLAVV